MPNAVRVAATTSSRRPWQSRVPAVVRGLAVGLVAVCAASLVAGSALSVPVDIAGRVEGGLPGDVSSDLLDQAKQVAFGLFPIVTWSAGVVAARWLRLPAWVPAVPAVVAAVLAGLLLAPLISDGYELHLRWPFDSVPVLLALVAVSPALVALPLGRRA